jgi:hypothetical protein
MSKAIAMLVSNKKSQLIGPILHATSLLLHKVLLLVLELRFLQPLKDRHLQSDEAVPSTIFLGTINIPSTANISCFPGPNRYCRIVDGVHECRPAVQNISYQSVLQFA